MDFMSRIDQIQSRIADIESQVNGLSSTPGSAPVDPAAFQQMLEQQMGGPQPNALPPGFSGYQPGQMPPNLTAIAPGPLSSRAAQFETIINDAAAQNGVDPTLVKSVIQQESAFNPNAVSSCGAQGLMQLMPATAKELGCDNAFDAKQNVMAGAKYLKQLLDRFHGDTSLALAGYNAGGGAVDQYGGIPPFAETQNYVKNILGYYSEYKKS